ncbi:phage holin family protein [Salisaeta longa]|uniref:phage holin family protein n=1 Tax=Salisaeta longa TaxID=503170 RepID=UPI0003B66ED3|nr:phage holin family protein [Salisaeta longa]
MEGLPDTPPSERRTPARPTGTKLQRMAAHTQGLVEDLREWVDARIDLALIEAEEQADARINQAIQQGVVAAVGALTGLFALLTVAWGLGWLLGHPFWGFLIVTVLLGVGTAVLRAADIAPVRTRLQAKLRGTPAKAAADSADEAPARPERTAAPDDVSITDA